MKNQKHFSRRSFIGKTAASALSFTILPSYLALGKQNSSGKLPPSQRLNLGCIGIGNRGSRLLKGLIGKDAVPVAFADVDFTTGGAGNLLKKFPDAKRFADFREMFDTMGDDIDAVSVATPDHTHFVATMDAMRRGKHVYTEKPLTHSFRESELLIQAEKKYKVVTQMGNQGHTSGGAAQFQQMVEGGVIRDITRVEAFFRSFSHPGLWFYDSKKRIEAYPTGQPVPDSLDWDLWCGPAEKKPFSSLYHPQKWRGFHLYGCGIFGDWGAHILDFVHDYLKLGLPTRVEKIEMQDHNQVIFPLLSKLTMKFPGRGEGMPPVDMEWTDGADTKPEVDRKYWDKTEDGELEPPKLNAKGQTLLHRKDGKFLISRASHGSPSSLLPKVSMKEYAEYIRQPRVRQNHQQNFVQACLDGGETTSPFRLSGELTQLLHLGVACQYLNESFDFDRETKRAVNHPRAQAVLDGPAPRKGWEEFYETSLS